MHDATNGRHPIHNRLLSVLPRSEFGFIKPHLTAVTYEPATLLARAGDPIRTCFFPNSGMVSLLCVTEQGRSIEAGYVGFEGMVGLPVVLGKNEMAYDALVQAPTQGFAADPRIVLELFNRKGRFHDVTLRFVYVVVKQMAQTCVCNHYHTIEARLCRWLSVMSERSGERRLRVTQEFLAHMLGVQRTSIGFIANSLQRTGCIKYSRGRVEILDPERMRSMACDCYRIVADECHKFITDEKFQPMSDIRQTTVAG